MRDALFRETAGPELQPLARSRALWGQGRDQMRGMAVSAVLARVVERSGAGEGLRLVRWSLDMFRPASLAPVTTKTEVVRSGKRLSLVDATLHQAGHCVARASALFLAEGAEPPGTVWASDAWHEPPPNDLKPTGPEPRLYYSEGIGWTGEPQLHQNACRKQTWLPSIPVIAGERLTPFQHAAMATDLVNVVTNWGDAGLSFINADCALTLGRLPTGDGIGLAAQHRFEHAGIAVGAALVFDATGPLGMATATALTSGQPPIDPRRIGTTAP
ncbi:acyl-CoA thioesterase domain-containing protein [Saccharomonospora sp. NPDC046836]|uniref:acyl-CoA thioesterase domain-containing protein n=1 Tax=Saccharomonospora sp. NPDC046836 TaxID=3156921 RepID=UPI0033C618C0